MNPIVELHWKWWWLFPLAAHGSVAICEIMSFNCPAAMGEYLSIMHNSTFLSSIWHTDAYSLNDTLALSDFFYSRWRPPPSCFSSNFNRFGGIFPILCDLIYFHQFIERNNLLSYIASKIIISSRWRMLPCCFIEIVKTLKLFIRFSCNFISTKSSNRTIL